MLDRIHIHICYSDLFVETQLIGLTVHLSRSPPYNTDPLIAVLFIKLTQYLRPVFLIFMSLYKA